jgi:hypothetical protein
MTGSERELHSYRLSHSEINPVDIDWLRLGPFQHRRVASGQKPCALHHAARVNASEMGQELTANVPELCQTLLNTGERSTVAGEGLAPFAAYDRGVNYCVSTTT